MEEELQPVPEDDMELEVASGDEDMTDDDVAASLGFITTLSQGLLPQDDMTTAEDEETEEPEEEPTEDRDEAQDEEIRKIREELEALKNEPETEDTEPA